MKNSANSMPDSASQRLCVEFILSARLTLAVPGGAMLPLTQYPSPFTAVSARS